VAKLNLIVNELYNFLYTQTLDSLRAARVPFFSPLIGKTQEVTPKSGGPSECNYEK